MNNIKLIYIDLFCGAGGTTTGVEQAEFDGQACAKVIACVNHDVNAIASHQANHPHTLHFTEDIRTLNLSNLITHLRRMKAKYPAALVILVRQKVDCHVMQIVEHLQIIFFAT